MKQVSILQLHEEIYSLFTFNKTVDIQWNSFYHELCPAFSTALKVRQTGYVDTLAVNETSVRGILSLLT